MQISKLPPGTPAPTPNGGPVNAVNLPPGGMEAVAHEATHATQQGDAEAANVVPDSVVSGADNMSDEMRARVEQMRQQGADTMGMQQLEPLDSSVAFPDQDYQNRHLQNADGAVSGAENMSDEMRQRLQEFQEQGPENTGMEQIKPTPDTSAREHAEAIKQKLREAMENVELPSFTWGAGSKPVIER
ncbi:MAG: hypothetical protein ACO1RX_18310 [Candidatus Sericytochromatia bacterium]